jgi:hypothetical protein
MPQNIFVHAEGLPNASGSSPRLSREFANVETVFRGFYQTVVIAYAHTRMTHVHCLATGEEAAQCHLLYKIL